MAWKKIETVIEGVAPTVMNCGQTIDPLNDYAKQIKEFAGKRSKTEDDYKRLYKLQWFASLYLNDDGKPYWPEDNLLACLLAAAGTTRGLRKRLEGGGLLVPEAHPIIYDGPTDPEKMYADPRFVLRVAAHNKANNSRIMSCRPIFRKWKLPLTVMYEPSIVNQEDVLKLIEEAGSRIGLACWRPRYGRFVVSK